MKNLTSFLSILLFGIVVLWAQDDAQKITLINNVQVWGGTSSSLRSVDLLIEGNSILEVGTNP